jgi:uncharacterized protein (DUF952 family)
MLIFHVCPRLAWDQACDVGIYTGGPDDQRDGFIHFSAAAQVEGSIAKHRAGQPDLVVLSVDPLILGERLKWETSRGGALFPHLYGPLSPGEVIRVDAVPLGRDGRHRIPRWLLYQYPNQPASPFV